MEPNIAVGLESTLDILVTFPGLEDFREFAEEYDGELSPYVKKGYEKVSGGAGGEMPVDGKKEEGKRLLELAKKKGAKLKYRLGGNGAQEAATLERLGSDTVFVGNISSESLSELSRRNQSGLDRTELKFAQTANEYSPASYILQASDTNRYILAEGEGRRIDQLRGYLEELPDTLERIEEEHGELDSLSLVGWHVVFGNGLSEEDFEGTTRVLDEIHGKTEALLFTDAGGAGALDETGKKRLYEIYSHFNILSVNEDEIIQISKKFSPGSGDRFERMSGLLEEDNQLSTIWLHTPNYQATLSSSLPRRELKEAQELASVAGSYKVEREDYPNYEDLAKYREKREFSEEGLEKVEEIREAHGEEIGGKNLVVTPCYKLEDFVSTVGAGDVSSAAYLYSLSKAH